MTNTFLKKLTWTTALASLLSLISISSLAGTRDGGGGKSVVCRDHQGRMTKVELLDLYEGRVQYGLRYVESKTPWQQQIAALLQRTELDRFQNELEIGISLPDRVAQIIKNLKLLPAGTKLNPINDSFEVVAPANCAIEQTANYQSDNSILIDGTIWGKMSETQKAALILHEALYRGLRENGESDSRRARHFNAYIFSGAPVQHTAFPATAFRVDCSSGESSYMKTHLWLSLVDDPAAAKKSLLVQVLSLNGRRQLSDSRLAIDETSTPQVGQPQAFSPEKFLSQLMNPTEDQWGIGGETKSLFEGGDKFRLLVNSDAGAKPRSIRIWGVSGIDNSRFDTTLTCGQF